MKNNIVLIGMPGAGKSTIGVVAAKMLGYDFLDSDLEIQRQYGKTLPQLLQEYGTEGFNQIENEVNAGLNCRRTVIATGGSVIYGQQAMEQLAKLGHIVYIRLSFEEIERRLGDLRQRGVSIKEGMSLRDLYEERVPLYEHHAELIFEAERYDLRESAEVLVRQLAQQIEL
ncbi:MAG: shikimate kinase [Lachnospiraceae bacterium]|nr:shikimate kinase [Lachnospiraceae bacterium]MDY5742872.1 shikimate kinase [Lachnospiraceae bacterium]